MEYDDLFIWHDREVRFDISKSQLGLRNGEKVFETIPNIEDTKGNNGDIGTLIFSNLRLIWYCQDNIKINLSLGYECIISTEIRTISSKVSGETTALALKCKFNGNRFEFLFNALANDSPNLFNSFNLIYKAYDTSRLYRDVKMKGFLTQDKNLITLPGEDVICKISGVGSVNNDGVVLGNFYMTNIRVVWFSNSLDNFNLSLPWIQIKNCKLRELNKSGKVVALESGKGVNVNIFYFKFSDKIETVIKDLETYHKKFIENPTLGIDLSDSKVVENINKPIKPTTGSNSSQIAQQENYNRIINSSPDDVEIIETNFFNEQSNMLYYMTTSSEKKNSINDIVYSPLLGLAVERLPDNVSIESLWKIIV